jgi:hypothetical protein
MKWHGGPLDVLHECVVWQDLAQWHKRERQGTHLSPVLREHGIEPQV